MPGRMTKQIKDMLKQSGKWNLFVAQREVYKAQGLSAQEAMELALADAGGDAPDAAFEPLDSADMQPEPGEAADTCDQTTLVHFAERRKASPRIVVEWVFDNMYTATVGPDDAPSPGAWGLLTACRRWPELQKEFFRSIYPRLLPTKSEVDAETKFTDDGSEILDLIERVSKASEEAKAAYPTGSACPTPMAHTPDPHAAPWCGCDGLKTNVLAATEADGRLG